MGARDIDSTVQKLSGGMLRAQTPSCPSRARRQRQYVQSHLLLPWRGSSLCQSLKILSFRGFDSIGSTWKMCSSPFLLPFPVQVPLVRQCVFCEPNSPRLRTPVHCQVAARHPSSRAVTCQSVQIWCRVFL